MARRRYELTDQEWVIIEPLLPNKQPGVLRVDDRRVLNGIFLALSHRVTLVRDAGAVWSLDDLLQSVRALAQSRCPGPAARRGLCRFRRRDRDDRLHLRPRAPARCDG